MERHLVQGYLIYAFECVDLERRLVSEKGSFKLGTYFHRRLASWEPLCSVLVKDEWYGMCTYVTTKPENPVCQIMWDKNVARLTGHTYELN